jgi:16S rRNA (cytosine967-C5)-methyltransferase
MNDRALALDALRLIIQKKSTISSYPKTLTPYSRQLIFGVCRYYFYLEELAKKLINKKPKELDIWVALLLGLYQLHFLKQPEYAVVKETVNLIKAAWAKGFVNAVLRNYCRNPVSLTYENNHAPWFIERVQQAWPNDWSYILKENDTHPPMVLRVNTTQISRDAYLTHLMEKGIQAHTLPYTPEALLLEHPIDVSDLPGFDIGLCAIQDSAAQLAAHLLALQPGDSVLDACAAPGGKTCHILEKEPQLKRCVALDIEPKRLDKVRENLMRLGHSATLCLGDASSPETWWDKQPFDKILLDAPCSATGVIRRHPDIKLAREPQDISQVVALQTRILNALWPTLAPGGRLVYATCSIMPEENELQIDSFLKTHQDARILTLDTSWGRATPHGRQILPGQDNMDGFFYSVLIRF